MPRKTSSRSADAVGASESKRSAIIKGLNEDLAREYKAVTSSYE